MNILLQAPGLLFLLIISRGLKEAIICLGVCAGVQIALGWPFLVSYPLEYLEKSFELSRVFTYKWTVNFKFLSEEAFVSKELSVFLLLCTLAG